MMRTLTAGVLECDHAVIEIGTHMEWYELAYLAEHGLPLFWDLTGEVRVILPEVLQDLWRLAQAHKDFNAVGRFLDVPGGCFKIAWEQAVPWSSVGVAHCTSNTGATPASPPASAAPTFPSPSR